MSPLRFRRLASFSSEDRERPAAGILNGRKWCCSDPGEASAWVILELEGLAKLSSIDIGNFGSALIEVQVSRSGSSDFKPLLPSSSFLNVAESRNMEHAERVRMFSQDKLHPSYSAESWDILKIICTQPFNKRVRYGLHFVTVHGVLDSKATAASPNQRKKIGSIVLKDEEGDNLSNGSLFSQRQALKKEPASFKASLSDDMKSKESLASLSLAISQRKEKEDSSQEEQKRIKEEQEERRRARKRKLESIHKLPSRNSETTAPCKVPKPVPPKTAPFKKLLSGVVFTISGFQNPLRSEIRSKALSMGAAYVGDWNSTCTHLVCAFTNTPKFTQVKGLRGKIVKKDWIERGSFEKKRFHWRKFALDPKDESGDFSDEEVIDESLVTSEGQKSSQEGEEEEEEAMDTDEEIDNILSSKDIKKEEEESPLDEGNDSFENETDKEEGDSSEGDEDYNASTDIESPDGTIDVNADFPELPNYFDNIRFYFYGSLENENLIQRIIIRAGGSVYAYMDPGVTFVVTSNAWDDNFDQAVKVNSQMRFVVPEYILKCCEANDKLPTKHYRTPEPLE